jgi:cytochrome P450
MTKLITDVEMPQTKSHLFPSKLTKYQQIEKNLEISKNTWIARFEYGYVIYYQDDIKKILTDKRWHNAMAFYAGVNEPGDTEEAEYYRKRRANNLLNIEGDDHFRLKNLVAPTFQHKNITYLKPFIHWIANSMLDNILEKKEFDIQKEFFFNLPVYVLCELTGLPAKDIDIFNRWVEAAFNSFSIQTPEEVAQVKAEQIVIDQYVLDLVAERTKNPKNDLITKLINAKELNDKLTADEVVMLIQVVMASGIDTTRNQLGLCLSYFYNHPEKWNEATKSREALNDLIDEAMAFDGVIRNIARFASEDIIYRDILFPKGTILIPGITVSNMNEPEKQPLTFGHGIHHCLGAALARFEIQEIFSIIAQRMPKFEIKTIEHRTTTHTIWGVNSMIVEVK